MILADSLCSSVTKKQDFQEMKFTIFKRMISGYALIVLMVLFTGIYVTLKLNQMTEINHRIAKVDGVTIALGEQLLEILFSQVGFERKYLIAGDPDFADEFYRSKALFVEHMQELVDLPNSLTAKGWIDEINRFYTRYVSLFEEEKDLVVKGKDFPRREYMEEKERIVGEIESTLRDLVRDARSQRNEQLAVSSRITTRALRVTAVAAVLTVLLGISISFLLTRNIARPISRLARTTKEIASGKFRKISDIASPPEIKELASDFNAMSERLQELDKIKLDFFSHISHELRTPLTSIKAASSMLFDGTFKITPERREELSVIIRDECDRLIASVSRILDISRMEAKMMDYHYSECDLLPVVQRAVLKLVPLAQKKKIDLELKPVPELPMVRIDPGRIAQVMENLIGNALKFTPERGKVTVSVYHTKGEEDFLQVYVTDSGCGILKQDLKRIFERFKRIEKGRETTMGTGLGLSIVKHIIADHGGKLWVRSAPRKGSTFSFALPVA